MGEAGLRPGARTDLDDIWDYIADRLGVEQAEDYLRRLARAFDLLSDRPQLGRPWNELYEGLRMFPFGKHLVLYLEATDGGDVVRVLHERMNIEDHLESD